MRETAFAKLNLALHVRAREPDGYHRIETLFAFCENGDVLSAAPGEGLSLTVTGPFAAALGEEADNLVLRAARALGIDDLALTLEKNLPVASGIGGGSADAAAALRLLGGGRADLPEIAASLGADVPACLASRVARGEGKGEQLSFVEDAGLAGMPVLLINPRVALSTAEVFAAWDGVDRGPLGDWREGRNNLEAPARRLVPEIGAVLNALAEAPFARMSGTGATCFGLFDSDASRDAMQARIAADHPAWWTLATRLK
jgi:4-diphosphocytidyl-2-C-methyl-D-erythritol kinase